jgi:hypothetical protein
MKKTGIAFALFPILLMTSPGAHAQMRGPKTPTATVTPAPDSNFFELPSEHWSSVLFC